MKDRQTELLDKEDPRFYAIDKGGSGIMCIATTEKVDNDIFSFGLPSSPALFLNQALNNKKQVDVINLKACFDEHPEPQGTWPDDHKMLFDLFELMIGQIIFSYSAIEAFANISIPKDFIFRLKRNDKKFVEEYEKSQIERHVNLDTKLDKVLPEIFNVKSPSGTKAWEDFQNIKKIRDRLIHLKSSDTTSSGPETKTIWGDLMRQRKTDFPKQVHGIISHYIAKNSGSRWFKKFPY